MKGRTKPALLKVERKPPNNAATALLPATVIGRTPVSIIEPVTIEAFVWPTVLPFALSLAQIKETLPFLLSSERLPLPLSVTVLIVVAIIPLRFGLRPAGDAGEGYESYG